MFRAPIVCLALSCLAGRLCGQEPVQPNLDRAPHTVHWFNSDGARLQYLDFGGRGPLLILVPGFGSTAHIFDDIAPLLTSSARVVAVTQRGFGESDSPAPSYELTDYADDIARLIGELHGDSVTLVGHSFGGWVITRAAVRHPQLVSKLVFLDAAYDLDRADSVISLRPFQRPSTASIKTNSGYFAWLRRFFYGMWTLGLESDATINAVHWDHRAAQNALNEARARPSEWNDIAVPSLAICALAEVHSEFPWLSEQTPEYAVAKQYVLTIRRPFQESECDRFAKTVPGSRTVRLMSGHYVFVSRAPEVAETIRNFILPQ